MRSLGLRPQLLLLLGGLLVLAFLPLQLALATYTTVTLRQVDDAQARALGHTLAAYVERVTHDLDSGTLIAELERGADESALVAASAAESGREPAGFGDPSVLDALRDASRRDDGGPHVLRVGEH